MTIKYSIIRRVRITELMLKRQEVVDWCWKNGYRIKTIGPKAIVGARVDRSRLVVVAEKVIK